MLTAGGEHETSGKADSWTIKAEPLRLGYTSRCPLLAMRSSAGYSQLCLSLFACKDGKIVFPDRFIQMEICAHGLWATQIQQERMGRKNVDAAGGSLKL